MSHLRVILGFVLIVSLCGCADNRASFFIQQVQYPASDCVIEAAEDALGISAGHIDIAYNDGYTMSPLMTNQLTPRGAAENLVAETNGIMVEGANIRIWRGGRPEGDTVYSFYQPAAGYVPPGGLGITTFTAVPSVAIEALLRYEFRDSDPSQLTPEDLFGYSDLVTVGVRMLGTTNGNAEVETPEFYFPVYICFGCLTICPADSAEDEDGDGELCEGTEAPEYYSCRLGVDGQVDCRNCVSIYSSVLFDQTGPFCRSLCGL